MSVNTGKLVGDKTLEAEGNIQKNLGNVQAKVGDIKQDVKGCERYLEEIGRSASIELQWRVGA